MIAPSSYSGAKIELIERDMKTDQIDTFIDRLISKCSGLKKVGIFTGDKDDGDLTEVSKSKLRKNGATFVEMKDFIESANITKTPSELNNLKVSSEFTNWTFKKIIDEVESVFEYNKTVKHSNIQKKIESYLEDETMMTSFLKNHPNIDSSFLEYPLPIQIHSGSNFSLNKFGVESSQDKLVSNAVYINVCSKFNDICSMASRTLLVNPKED